MAGLQHDYALRAITRREVDFASTIASFDSVEGLAEAFHGLEAIIHLGADPSPDAPWDSIRDNNINATYNVFEACVRAGVKRMIFASTNHTMHGHTLRSLPENLDPDKKVKLKLTDPVNPDSLYAVSKLFGEQIGKLYSERHGLEFVRHTNWMADRGGRSDDKAWYGSGRLHEGDVAQPSGLRRGPQARD